MVIPKVISPTMDSSWHVNPKEAILNVDKPQEISIQFHPKKDFVLLQQSKVLHIATIKIIHADEPTCQRIQRLYNKIKESGASTAVTESEIFKNRILPLIGAFPKKQLIPSLTSIRDPTQYLSDLCTGVHQDEIMLTVKVCADDTSLLHCDTDVLEPYYSLVVNDATLVDGTGGGSSTLLKPL
ncbi:uncharacterized protein LOC105203579 [Solenopsis invicta]|uniref:uncharacterized protein LOC105203579 n=1 Tax=Solenopsis invicta TaxID=13686 RepID=UPI00193CBFDA|nr:uncharacterized protein LOC105203579 [Solenopsis invicta]